MSTKEATHEEKEMTKFTSKERTHWHDDKRTNWRAHPNSHNSAHPTTDSHNPSRATGDPHMKTWTGDKCDFHGACNSVVLHNLHSTMNGVGMDVDTRTNFLHNPHFTNGVDMNIHTRTNGHEHQQLFFSLDLKFLK